MGAGDWIVEDVTSWDTIIPDSRGRRSKVWVRDPAGNEWLRKVPRLGRPSEVPIEAFALELANLVAVEAADARPCVFRDAEGEHRALLSRRFAGSDDLQQGDSVLRGADDAYDPENHALHTPTAVVRALRNFEERGDGLELVSSFCSVLAFDAWIGNGDRHPQNWALLSIAQGAVRRLRLAPMYDPANCLGVELQDDHLLLGPSTAPGFSARLREYINRCPSGFGDGYKLIPMVQVVEDLRREPCWRDVYEASVARFRVALDTQVSYLVDRIPEDWLSRPRKVLTCSLLRDRLKWLESKGPPR